MSDKVVKKNDVTCWNCFTKEDRDPDTDDDKYQPITLPKVRKENREKFKVYSFFASELSKPKSIPLKQKVSKHCTIGKKIDEKVLEKLTKDTENMDLECDKNNTPDEPKSIKQIQENIVQTVTGNKADINILNKISDIQDVETVTFEDVINDIITETTTQCKNVTQTESFSMVDANTTVQKNSDIKHDLSNAIKTELELALPKTTPPPQLKKEILFISSNENPDSKTLDIPSQKPIEPEDNIVLKGQSSIPSHLEVDIKSSDLTDRNNCADNIKDFNVLQDSENSKTKTITKLPILKQNINSRYSPLHKLKRTLSTDKAVPHDRIDIIYKSLSETIPIVGRKNYKERVPKEVDVKTTGSDSISKIETKPLTALSKTESETKIISLLPNQSKSSSTQVSSINKEKSLNMSTISTITSKTLPNVTPPIIRKQIQKESIISKSLTSKTHTIIPTEKITILKRKSSELFIDTKSKDLTDSSFCSENIEDMNLSQEGHRKYSKSDIGTKLPILKQSTNSKYSPLQRFKMAISKDKVNFNKDDTTTKDIKYSPLQKMKMAIIKNKLDSNKDDTSTKDTSLNESINLDYEEKSEDTTLEIENLSDKDVNRSQIPLVTSTLKKREIDNKSSDASDEKAKSNKSLYSMSESTAESEDHNAGECKNTDKSESSISVANKTSEKEINVIVSGNKKFSKSRSLSTETLGKILCPSIIRRSTLSMDPRSLSLADEMYISEETPGHATLPRRSNSPLPHERDLDRERFPLNRSGLQTRSESMASVYSGAGEGVRGGVPVRGEVQFSLVYNYRLGALEVGVKRCRDLAPIDVKKNRSDPYVKVYLLPDKSKTGKRKTKVKKNTLNPVFEETLSFQSSLESLSTRALWLSAWHADMFGRNDFLGEVTLPLAGRVFDDPAPGWHALGERSERPEEASGSRGDLIVGLKFELEPRASTGTLHVLVKEARRLVPSRPGALADVFCKSYLLPERGRLHKQKTPVCRRTLAPSWRAGLQYSRVAAAGLSERALELTLWDRDRLASNEFLGAVRLSRGTGMYRGESVNWMDSTGKEVSLWETMLQQPNFWVEGSLPLRPHLNN